MDLNSISEFVYFKSKSVNISFLLLVFIHITIFPLIVKARKKNIFDINFRTTECLVFYGLELEIYIFE